MKKLLIKIIFVLGLIGFDTLKLLRFLRGFPIYYRNYRKLKKQMKLQNEFVFGKFWPVLNDSTSTIDSITHQYFYQDLLIAQSIYKNKPKRHIDIGSRIDGFVANVASFREIEIYDIRQLVNRIDNVVFTKFDLMNLPEDMKVSCDSISSLHAIEHFGLGRYGDPIDVNGHLKAINNIYFMLKPKGKFYFSVPIGTQRIEYNAHRVFSIKYLIDILKDKFIIDNFSYIDESNNLFTNVELTKKSISSNFNTDYGCGIFDLTKK